MEALVEGEGERLRPPELVPLTLGVDEMEGEPDALALALTVKSPLAVLHIDSETVGVWEALGVVEGLLDSDPEEEEVGVIPSDSLPLILPEALKLGVEDVL